MPLNVIPPSASLCAPVYTMNTARIINSRILVAKASTKGIHKRQICLFINWWRCGADIHCQACPCTPLLVNSVCAASPLPSLSPISGPPSSASPSQVEGKHPLCNVVIWPPRCSISPEFLGCSLNCHSLRLTLCNWQLGSLTALPLTGTKM